MIETTCENCQFKIMDGSVQIDCAIGVLDQLKVQKKTISDITINENQYKKFDGVCMYRRTKDWSGDTELLKKEVFIPSTFIIIHTGDIDKLKRTIESIKWVYSPKPIRTIVCHESNNFAEIKQAIDGLQNCSYVYLVDKLYKDIMYDEAFRRAKNGWVFFVESGIEVPMDYLNNININKNVFLLDFVAVNGAISGYMSVVYKWLHGCKGIHIKEKLSNIPGSTISQEEIDENMRVFMENV